MADDDELVGDEGVDEANLPGRENGKRDLAKQRRLIRLSVPRGEPGRLVELEESVIKAIRQLFDDLHDTDLSIERAGKGVSELMATRITKVGVDCQKHRRRPVRHPAAYRATGKAGQGGGTNRSQTGPWRASRGLREEVWIEPTIRPSV